MQRQGSVAVGLITVLACACGAAQRGLARPDRPTTIRVLEAGVEPRVVLRYDLAPGLHERAELTAKATVSAAITNTVLETGLQRTELPTEKTIALFEVRGRDASRAQLARTIEEAVLLDDGVIDAPTRSRLQREVDRLRGGWRTWSMSPIGEVSQPTMDGTESATIVELVKLATLQTSVRFPDEAVGVGAAWQVTSHPRISGISWDRIATYRLRAASAAEIKVDVEIVMKAGEQPLRVEPNATTELRSATVRMTGGLTVPLRGLVATGYGESIGEVNLRITDKRVRATSTTQIITVFTSKSLGPPR